MGFQCKFYKPKDSDKYEYNRIAGTPCGNCKRWNGKMCEDEAEVNAYYDREFEKWDREMRANRGVRIDG